MRVGTNFLLQLKATIQQSLEKKGLQRKANVRKGTSAVGGQPGTQISTGTILVFRIVLVVCLFVCFPPWNLFSY